MLLLGLRSALMAKLEEKSERHEMETAGSTILTGRVYPSLMCIQEPSLVAHRMTSLHSACVFAVSINSASQDIHGKTITGPKTCQGSDSLAALNESVQGRGYVLGREADIYNQSQSPYGSRIIVRWE